MKTLSFRTRLTFRWTAAFFCVLVLANAAIYAGVRAFLFRDLDAQLRTLAGTELASAIDEYRGVHLHDFPAGSLKTDDYADKFVQLLDGDGGLLMQSANLGSSRPLLDRDVVRRATSGGAPVVDVTAARRPGRMTALATQKDGRNYIVAVGLFTDRLQHTLAQLRWLLAVVSIGGLVVTALVGFALATRALAPIAHVTDRAATIARGDFAARLDPPVVADELGRMTSLLNEMLERLHGALEANRRFAADASHELRSPLTAMLGEIDVTLKRDRSAAEYRESLAVVRERIRELTDLAENLIILVRAQEGHAPAPAEVPLESLVQQSAARLALLAAERGIEIKLGSFADVVVYGDAGLLSRVFDNLLRNAIQYNRPGGSVDVSARAEEPTPDAWASGTVTVRVRDTGHGIADVDFSRVFERFYRTDRSRSRRTGGAGLGLSIASEVVALFGGTIRIAESTPAGTSVEVKLPGAVAVQ